jgi:hypothetical protein
MRWHTVTVLTPPPSSSFPPFETPLHARTHKLVAAYDAAEPERLRAIIRSHVSDVSSNLALSFGGGSTTSEVEPSSTVAADTEAAAPPASADPFVLTAEETTQRHLAQLQLLYEISSLADNHHALTLEVLLPVTKALQAADLDVREACVNILWMLCSTNDAIMDELVLQTGLASKLEERGGEGMEGGGEHVDYGRW